MRKLVFLLGRSKTDEEFWLVLLVLLWVVGLSKLDIEATDFLEGLSEGFGLLVHLGKKEEVEEMVLFWSRFIGILLDMYAA